MPVRKKDLRWLEMIARFTENPLGMYPGYRADLIPDSVAKRIGDLIYLEFPHNRSHKPRYVITEKGQEVLDENS